MGTPLATRSGHPVGRSEIAIDPAFPSRRGPAGAELVALAVSILLATIYLTVPPTGTDLPAQLTRAGFAGAHPTTPVDLSWFGGTEAFSYSVVSPYLMAILGVRLTGAVCCVAASWLLARLFVRTGARHAVWAAALGAALQALNLVAGRVTFGLGTVFGLACLVALASGSGRSTRHASAWAVLCGLSSPVAAFFLVLCATTLAVVRRPRQAVVVGLAAAVPVLLVESAFGQTGRQPFHQHDLLVALGATLAVGVVAGRRRELRWGVAVTALATVLLSLLATPLGDNVCRLSLVFAPAVAVGYTPWRGRWLPLVLAMVSLPQQLGEVNALGLGSESSAGFYAPLAAEVQARQPVIGRLEIPETWAHWDAYVLASTAPLARGWNRQLDVATNPLFFRPPLDPTAYRRWLRRERVQYVAVPDVTYTAAGLREVDLIRSGLPFLVEIWSAPGWHLYRVVRPRPIVPRPAELVSMDSAAVTLTAPARSTVHVGVRMTRWTTLVGDDSGACLATDPQGDAVVHSGVGGRYRLTSTLGPRSRRCSGDR